MHWFISFLKYILILDQKRRLQYQQELNLTNHAKKKKKKNQQNIMFIYCVKKNLFYVTDILI